MKLQHEFETAKATIYPAKLSPEQRRYAVYGSLLNKMRKKQKERKENNGNS